MVEGNKLMNAMTMNGGNVVPSDSPVKNTSTVTALLEVKQLVLSNARILYGSEQRKFFDFVTGRSAGGRYICVLVCSLDGYTRILRKETNASPLEAARALADGLISDAGDLFGKADVGDQLHGQQGYREEDGKFHLDACKTVHRFCGPADDTRTLRPEYRYDRNDAPQGPAADRKRHHRDGD
ncbi:hypothetical protein SLS60_006213 [Paraconiothyrium brasiliense]|uniref:Uncharacterized protein n=1 Tax=Paraconiothyrium brasiliense TaxID=300254 RepID=A0ABR3REK6_9PLEO